MRRGTFSTISMKYLKNMILDIGFDLRVVYIAVTVGSLFKNLIRKIKPSLPQLKRYVISASRLRIILNRHEINSKKQII